ncbi:MAG: hypothetical protein A4E30_00580 [Methanomassiliicoccales archaeon PtaB.Bin215]|nr:MAG: hypothetical protein A4E30_00580 [Methanomassiliicoccales archaeon PtaB.Bin215]
MAARSAPVYPSVLCATSSRLTSSASGFRLKCTCRMAFLVSRSGAPTCIRRSKRPGRSSAGSIMSGRFVAAMTTTLCNDSNPSSSVSSCEITLSVTCESESPPRVGAMESISSMKMMHGAACLALRKVSRTAFSLSPTHLLRNSGPLMLMKLLSDSVATAFASMVFPVPGGPYRSTPLGGSALMCSKRPAYFSGHSTASFSSAFTASNPPISSQCRFGDSISTSRMLEGDISLSAAKKSSLVTVMRFSTSMGMVSASRSRSGRMRRRECMAASLHSAARSAPA